MNATTSCDIFIAITGSGGAGSITAGELLLSLAGKKGCFGMMRRSFRPQSRGGEAAALVRIRHQLIVCMNDSFDMLVALGWRNAERSAGEITGHSTPLIIADPASGDVPARIRELGYRIVEVSMKALAAESEVGWPNMVALGVGYGLAQIYLYAEEVKPARKRGVRLVESVVNT